MSNDLVKRLRAAKKATDPWDAWHLSNKAADHIDELRKDLLVVLGMLSERLPAAEKCEMAYEYLLERRNGRNS